MRPRAGVLAVAATLVAGAGVFVACTGGPGTLSPTDDYLDSPGRDLERPPTGRESPPAGESPPGADVCNCAGTYRCRVSLGSNSASTTLTLTKASGGCVSSDGKTLFGCDGRVREGSNTVATWRFTGSGFTAEGGGTTVTCTRTSAQSPTPTLDASTEDLPGTGGKTDIPPLDAGP